jgi:AbrB family looped-hinge helix DNA binding protein
MQTVVARLSSRYQVVIPKPVREALELQPQDSLLFLVDRDGEDVRVILRPQPASFTKALRGLHKDIWPDPDEWLEEERSSWE